MKGIHIFLAEGFEDMEALGTLDILRRGGADVQTVATGDVPFVTSSHGVTVSADCMFSDLEPDNCGTCEKDFLIFPGGMPGSKNLASDKRLMALMQEHYDAGGSVAAICAAPGLVLSQLKGVAGHRFTCFDGFEEQTVACGGIYEKAPAVRSGRVITGRSAGYAIPFALEILSVVRPEGRDKAAFGVYLEK